MKKAGGDQRRCGDQSQRGADAGRHRTEAPGEEKGGEKRQQGEKRDRIARLDMYGELLPEIRLAQSASARANRSFFSNPASKLAGDPPALRMTQFVPWNVSHTLSG